jgi:hypothetical protein
MPEVFPKENSLSPNQSEKEYLITKIVRQKLSKKGSLWNRQFPTLLGLIILLGGLVGGTFLIREGRAIRGRTIEASTPREIKITNISENSFTVSWISDIPTSGFIASGKTPSLGETFLEDRDILSKGVENYYTHHVTITNLEASTTYYFKVGSGKKLFGQNGSPFKVTTALLPSSSPVSDPAYGQILKDDGAPAGGTIVYLKPPNCTTLSSLVRDSGNWLIPLNLSRTEDLTDFCQYSKRGTKIEIFAQGGPFGESRATVLTGLEKPVPNITLGQNSSFEDFSLVEPVDTSGTTVLSPEGILGDLNNDGVVNTSDLGILRLNWGTSPKDAAADLNNDGVVDEKDLEILQQHWSQ